MTSHSTIANRRWRFGVRVGATVICFGAPLVAAPVASAMPDLALNGTFHATSNGQFAKTRGIYRNEATVSNTWTIKSTCTDPYTCTGTVTSDNGWTAPLHKTSTTWIVTRDIPNWEPCPNGEAYPGAQTIRFWQVGDDGLLDLSNQSPVFAGEDKTVGPTGACGVSMWLDIAMPFRLVKVS
jgi:hypothetical protein